MDYNMDFFDFLVPNFPTFAPPEKSHLGYLLRAW